MTGARQVFRKQRSGTVETRSKKCEEPKEKNPNSEDRKRETQKVFGSTSRRITRQGIRSCFCLDPRKAHVKAVCYVLYQLWKYSFSTNLKKYCFHQEKICFLRYVISSKKIQMKEKKIEVIKKLPEFKSVQDIHVFIGFANFYRQFIQVFNRIVAPLILMLKTGSPDSKVISDGGNIGASSGGNACGNNSKRSKEKLPKSKCGNLAKFRKNNAIEAGPSFLTPVTRKVSNQLRLTFIKISIFCYFNPECHIWIETYISGYAIKRS